MAKNMTRKGLAAGAGFALVSAGLVASPAYAVDPIVTEPAAGTSLNVLAEESFVLKTLFTNAAQAASENLKYEIVDADKGLVMDNTNANTAAGTGVTGTPPDVNAGQVPANDANSDGTAVVDSGEDAAGTANYLRLKPAAPAAGEEKSFSVVVTAWLDFDGDNEIDGGEASLETTVNFFAYDDVSLAIDVTDAELGTAGVEAEATFSPMINTSFIANLAGSFSGASYSDTNTSVSVAEKTDTEGTVVLSDTSEANLSADDLTVEFSYGGDEIDSVVYTVPDNKVDTVTAALVDNLNTTSAGKVRTGTTSGEVEFALKDSNGDALGAGIPVELTIENANTNAVVGSDDTLTVAGEEVENGDSADVTVRDETNADGKVVVDFSSTAGKAGNKFELSASAEGNSDTIVVEFEDAAFSAMTIDQNIAQHTNYAVTTEAEGSFPVTFSVDDQFGAPITDSGYFVSVVTSATTRSTASEFATSRSFSNGKATITVADEDGSGTGVDTYTATLYQLNANGTSSATGVTVDLEHHIASATTVAEDGLSFEEDANENGTADSAIALTDNAGDLDGTEPLTLAELSEVSTDPNGQHLKVLTTVAGATITLEAPGVAFKVATTDVVTVGSMTGNADANGDLLVSYHSNTAGAVDIVVSSGDDSATLTATFAAAAEDTGTNLVVDAPDNIQSGKTIQYRVSLSDKYGNPVNAGGGSSELAFSYDGPGLVVGTDATELGTDGEHLVSVLLGSNDTDSATLTVSYSTADTDFTDDEDIVVQKTVTIGASATGSGAFNAWTKLIENDTAVKFYAKNPSNQGKIQFFFNGEEIAWHRGTSATSYEGGEPRYNEDQDAYYLVRDVELVSGIKNVFEIEQDGERIWRAVKTLD